MTRAFDRLFAFCGALAAIFLVGIAVLVLSQVIGRLAGIAVPSADEFAGYCLSASSFLALGYALRRDAHIRVTLLIDRLPRAPRRVVEFACLIAGLALSTYFTFYTVEMVYWSVTFNDVTQGLIILPLWLPQMGMLIGAAALTLAFLADVIAMATGGEPAYLLAARKAEKARDDAAADLQKEA